MTRSQTRRCSQIRLGSGPVFLGGIRGSGEGAILCPFLYWVRQRSLSLELFSDFSFFVSGAGLCFHQLLLMSWSLYQESFYVVGGLLSELFLEMVAGDFWLPVGKSEECLCDQHGRLLLQRTLWRSGMRCSLFLVVGFVPLWTILLGTNLGAFRLRFAAWKDTWIS